MRSASEGRLLSCKNFRRRGEQGKKTPFFLRHSWAESCMSAPIEYPFAISAADALGTP
jgi:hypothetical protein